LRYTKTPMGDEETYNILVFLCVVCDLGDCDSACDILVVLGFAWLVSRDFTDLGIGTHLNTQ
jgi:hypothetical protein